VQSTATAEADDLFAMLSHKHGPEQVVIVTQDKDMRMVPGWHMRWDDHMIAYMPPGTDTTWGEKVYGERWFWMQMLHGDPADNIPGLPRYSPDGVKSALIGEVTTRKLLDPFPLAELPAVVEAAYRSHYGAAARLHMVEQGVLLWMRRRPVDVLDVCNNDYGPLVHILDAEIRLAIKERYDPQAQAE
jgi:DNA polymerase-1